MFNQLTAAFLATITLACSEQGNSCTTTSDCCVLEDPTKVAMCLTWMDDDAFCQYYVVEPPLPKDCHWYGFDCTSDSDCCFEAGSSSLCDYGFCQK